MLSRRTTAVQVEPILRSNSAEDLSGRFPSGVSMIQRASINTHKYAICEKVSMLLGTHRVMHAW